MKKILTISILLSALTLTGCKDFLVQEPITSQSTDQLMSTYNGLNNAVAGAYSPLATNYWYGGLYFLLDADTRAGIAAWPLSSDFQSGRMQTGFTLNYNENSTNGPWTYAYYVIFAANSVIEQLEANSASLVSSIVTQQDLDNIKAESLTLRALGHFDLLRVYSRNDYPELGVPVITVPQESSDQPARNTIAEVYAQIEKDLTDAEALISPDYVRSGVADANATINIWTIRALLARVYLYDATFSGDASKYQLAADYATQVIESGKYTHDQVLEILQFLQKELHCKNPETKNLEDSELAIYLKKKLNRPMRVCGMVKNVGEPGGGPFLAYNSDGTISLQILESSQIDMTDPEKKEMFEKGTHFNPVDLVCAVRDYKGNKFDLVKYVDKATGFISYKSKNGKELKALELPGLWNGAMSDWNTIFVEVPLSTFNPVKTVNDLLRDQHQ